METLKVMDLAPQIRGPKIVTLSCSGGEAAIIGDFAPTVGLETPRFSQQQVANLESQLPDYVSISNPFDYNTSVWGDRPALTRCFTAALAGNHDAAFLVYDHPSVDVPEVSEWIDSFEAFITAQKTTGVPAFVVSSLTELMPREIRDRALEHGIVPLHGIEDGLHAYAAAARYLKFRDERMSSMTIPRRAELAFGEPAALTTYDEWQSKQQLAAAGLPVPAGSTCTAAEAPDVAENIGFPVVVKAVGRNFMHKADLGAVKLNVASCAAVKTAVEQITRSAKEQGLNARLFLVEAMVTGVVAEVIVGVKRDEQFGPALVIGSGGILVELVADSASLLLPTDREAIRDAILGLSVAQLLRGYRGAESADIEGLIDAVLAIASYAEANWENLQELDVNPLMVLGTGQGVVAADALIVHR
jgi:acyl-CoA synthetase (NDP forming)